MHYNSSFDNDPCLFHEPYSTAFQQPIQDPQSMAYHDHFQRIPSIPSEGYVAFNPGYIQIPLNDSSEWLPTQQSMVDTTISQNLDDDHQIKNDQGSSFFEFCQMCFKSQRDSDNDLSYNNSFAATCMNFCPDSESCIHCSGGLSTCCATICSMMTPQ